MKLHNLLYLLIIICILGCDRHPGIYFSDKDESYRKIDEEIKKIPLYDKEKEARINILKKRLNEESAPQLKYEIINWLIDEYEAFTSDSALYYINLNLNSPIVRDNSKLKDDLLIRKANVSAHAGLFREAATILEEINREELDADLLENYYAAYCDLYQYQSEYTQDTEYANFNERQREQYIDSVVSVASPESINYITYWAASKARKGETDEAEWILTDNLKKYNSGERAYSILASILANVYKDIDDEEKYHKYLALSVISDIRGAVKENMAIRALAIECYNDGELERANRYLLQSFADANFYAARMRNAQSSQMLPIIEDAYNSQQKGLNRKLRLFVIFISLLAFGFIVISIYAFKQVKKVREVNRQTKSMLEEVSALSEQLGELNTELSDANRELQDSNKIKEEYAVLFMEYCSLAISSLHQYQQSLRVSAAQGNMATLIKKIESGSVENKTLVEFYSKFDEAILNIYPLFIEKFNSLLRPEERIVLKPKEGLNTELRVFALVRIGINDSEKIAKFLCCSLATVYTYRSRLKKKALNPDTFETDLLKI